MKYDLFFVSRSKVPEYQWKEFKNRFLLAQKMEDVNTLDQIKAKSLTKFFWVVWNDLQVVDGFCFDYAVTEWDRQYIHVFKNGEHFDGICMFSKNHHVTQKEFDHRFFSNKKEIDIVASTPRPFEKFVIDTYDDYLTACQKSSMAMLWLIPKEAEVLDFDFALYFSHHNIYNRNINHVFQHVFGDELTYNGVMLVPKNKMLSKKEIDFRFPIEKKMYEIVASQHRAYDIIFISYNEANADDNFNSLILRFPLAKRIHGVKGIHNAHKKAAEIATTDMFFVVDGDAAIVDDFKFDHMVTRYERDIVHIWQSRNPINDLIYGYGGAKLLPRDLVLAMDVDSVDMTTSISARIKVMDSVSNTTEFNTDGFSTWKSAFRECVKLSSKPVDENYDEQTDYRLQAWCSLGSDKPFGEYALAGALAGREYGYENIGNAAALAKINDFDWLEAQYEQRTKNIHP